MAKKRTAKKATPKIDSTLAAALKEDAPVEKEVAVKKVTKKATKRPSVKVLDGCPDCLMIPLESIVEVDAVPSDRSKIVIDDLLPSVAWRGLVVPLGVRPKVNGKYALVYGRRRLRAIKTLKRTEPKVYKKHFDAGIKVVLVEGDDKAALSAQGIENNCRVNLSLSERVQSIERYKTAGMRPVDIEKVMGLNKVTVANNVRFVKEACDALRKAVDEGEISFHMAHNIIVNNSDADSQKTVLDAIRKIAVEVDDKRERGKQQTAVSRGKSGKSVASMMTEKTVLDLRESVVDNLLDKENDDDKSTFSLQDLTTVVLITLDYVLGECSDDEWIERFSTINKYSDDRVEQEEKVRGVGVDENDL